VTAVAASAAAVFAHSAIVAGMVLTCGGLNTAVSPDEGAPRDRYCDAVETDFDGFEDKPGPTEARARCSQRALALV
jgi:hypothetical protein